jgi:hypothetical protein
MDTKDKVSPSYIDYQKYLEEVVFAEEIKDIKEKEKENEIQKFLPGKCEEK